MQLDTLCFEMAGCVCGPVGQGKNSDRPFVADGETKHVSKTAAAVVGRALLRISQRLQ